MGGGEWVVDFVRAVGPYLAVAVIAVCIGIVIERLRHGGARPESMAAVPGGGAGGVARATPAPASYSEGDLEDFVNGTDSDQVSPEEADEIARDLKMPPYHLSSVDETEDETPTGEYELCPKCYGGGCPECEEGLIDVTGVHEIPKFD